MTEQQIEILQHQIVEMYKSFIIAQQYFFGPGPGNPYLDPLMASGAPKIRSLQGSIGPQHPHNFRF
ncbi:hypothetical protein QJS04_geneDACA014307 [Acorus gramineus]|uniref:Uncharacterized protein n=1 Tax=Acorus gramineus TaxID=55184 RepID=A0AAV9BUY0_ACOGR|nr:hypothetical protein QJS04_geneDACA014307 [Acorus gramineus]